MSDTYDTTQEIEARLNRLCNDAANDIGIDAEDLLTKASQCGAAESIKEDSAIISQQMVRTERTESAVVTDTLSGSFRCQFEPTQTIYVLHVPIFPPMKTVPEVEAICEREDILVRVTQAKKFGLRIELKRVSDCNRRDSVIAEVTAASSSCLSVQ
jgi:hypothetical protein